MKTKHKPELWILIDDVEVFGTTLPKAAGRIAPMDHTVSTGWFTRGNPDHGRQFFTYTYQTNSPYRACFLLQLYSSARSHAARATPVFIR